MQYPTIAQPQYAFAPTMMAEGGLVPTARAVQSKGRGNDSMLVHMSPREVGGLQALAMQHGGSLSINPNTGLPEAGFLEDILPTVLGIGGTFLGIPPHITAMAVGGIETVRTGDLGRGFMAGLGAYGGGNLAGSLSSAGAQQGVQAAGAAGQDLMNQAVTNPAMAITETGAQLVPTATTPQTIGDIYRAGNAQDALLMRGAETLPASVQALPAPTSMAPSFMQNAAQAGQGVQNLFASGATGEGARAAALGNIGGYSGLAKNVGMAGAPMIASALTPEPYKMPEEEKSEYEGPYKPSERQVSYPGDDLRRRTSEFMYFTPSNPIPFAEGGETAGAEPDVVVSPNEAKVYQDILNVQRLAGLPAIDPSRFAVMPGRSYEQFVYNPIEAGVGPEKDYGFAPLMSKEEAEKALAPKEEEARGFGGLFGRAFRDAGFDFEQNNPIIGYTASGEPLYQNKPSSRFRFAKGGAPTLEEKDYGFKPQLTKENIENQNASNKIGPGSLLNTVIGYGSSGNPMYKYNPQVPLTPFSALQRGWEAVNNIPSIGARIHREAGFSKGGVPMLEDGGFVLTKKAVDGLGKGDNKRGQKAASRGLGAIPIKGPGTGTSDSIKTSIEGKRPALVSNGEAYVPKKQVAKRGGAKAFYALMDKAEKQAKKAKRA
jgi:hypothetical protein